ncbi:MAG: hypothetical protein RLZZ385_1792 [Pseudomonadota bacterium]
MYLKRIALSLLLAAMAMSPACTTILVETTGSQGIQEDPGRRTAGAVVEDQSIETKIAVNMKSQEPAFRKAHFDVISHNGVVLLVGQVPSEQLKSMAGEIAAAASTKIKRIHNELEVGRNTSFMARSNDTWIGTKVRTQILADKSVPSDQVRVVTENGSVYLLGLITQEQGDNAAALARNVSGVARVVKVFEYIN